MAQVAHTDENANIGGKEVIISNRSKAQIGFGEDLKTPSIVATSNDWLGLSKPA